MEEIPQDFERLVPFKENNSIYNVQLVQCRDPLIFGQLALFRKQLAEFLMNAAQSSVTRAKAALELENPNLIQLKCSNEEIAELNKFYLEQSTYIE